MKLTNKEKNKRAFNRRVNDFIRKVLSDCGGGALFTYTDRTTKDVRVKFETSANDTGKLPTKQFKELVILRLKREGIKVHWIVPTSPMSSGCLCLIYRRPLTGGEKPLYRGERQLKVTQISALRKENRELRRKVAAYEKIHRGAVELLKDRVKALK